MKPRTKEQALEEVLQAIRNGEVIEDHRGRVYQQYFGEAFVEMLQETLRGPSMPCETCGGSALPTGCALESYPPRLEYKCPSCNAVQYKTEGST